MNRENGRQRPSVDADLVCEWSDANVGHMVSTEAQLAAILEVTLALVKTHGTIGTIPCAVVDRINQVASSSSFTASLPDLARGFQHPVDAVIEALTTAVTAVYPAATAHVWRSASNEAFLDSANMILAARVMTHIAGDLTSMGIALARLAGGISHDVAFRRVVGSCRAAVLAAADRTRMTVEHLPAQLDGETAGLGAENMNRTYDRVDFQRGHVAVLVDHFSGELGLAAPTLQWRTLRIPIADIGWALSIVGGAVSAFASDVEGIAGRGGDVTPMPLVAAILDAAHQLSSRTPVLTQSVFIRDGSAERQEAELLTLRETLKFSAGMAKCGLRLAQDLSGGLASLGDAVDLGEQASGVAWPMRFLRGF